MSALRRNVECKASDPDHSGSLAVCRTLGAGATYVHLLDGDLGEPLTIPQTVRNDAK